jgi:hypothetical protein
MEEVPFKTAEALGRGSNEFEGWWNFGLDI